VFERAVSGAYALMLATMLAVMVIAAPAAQNPPLQQPGTVAQPALYGPFRIVRGRVVDESHRPIPRASVRMLSFRVELRGGNTDPPPPGCSRPGCAGMTDLDGRFELVGGLDSYRLRVEKHGYLPAEYGEARPFEPGKTLVVDRNTTTLEGLDVTLRRAGAISGRIVDDAGDPVEGVAMRLMQVQRASGLRRLSPVIGVPGQATDDRGQYRLFGVPPGQFIVVASTTERPTPTLEPLNLPGQGQVFFPGTTDPSGAQLITLGPAEDRQGVDFPLTGLATSRVTGRVFESTGRPLSGSVLLRSRSESPITTEFHGTLAADGRFTIQDVPAGEWVLQASGPKPVRNRETEFAAVDVSVGAADLTDLVIRTSNGSTVSGRVRFEGVARVKPLLSVSTVPADLDRTRASDLAVAPVDQANDSFELGGLSGPRRIVVDAGPQWILKTLRVNGVDRTDQVLPFGTTAQSLENVELVLTNRIASLTGNVTDARGVAVADYAIVVFPTQEDRWFQRSRFVKTARPTQTGTFSVERLPAGEYYVAAVNRLEGADVEGEWHDPEFLRTLALRATRVRLAESQQLSVSLRMLVR
jgi:hypothetical protein